MAHLVVLTAGATVVLGVALWTWRRRRVAERMERVARASHELRGALGAIGLAIVRMDGPASNARERRVGLDAVRAQHGRAVLAVDDLDAAHAGSAEPSEPHPRPVDLEPLVRSAVRSWAAVHGRWRIVLDWRAGRPVVRGHEGRLGQALDNLIANALEHGGGPVTIVGRLSGDSVTVSILDHGGGLRRSLETSRPVSWRSRRGHGLVVARQAVELHGGRLRLVRENRGAGVEITLPLTPGAPSANAVAGSRPAPRLPPGVARSA
jgi:signal transduction histidine kinase